MIKPQIDRNIPIPDRGFDYAGWSEFLKELKVGDSFRFKRADLPKLKMAAAQVNLAFGKTNAEGDFIWESNGGDEIRIWRQGPPGPDEQVSPLTT